MRRARRRRRDEKSVAGRHDRVIDRNAPKSHTSRRRVEVLRSASKSLRRLATLVYRRASVARNASTRSNKHQNQSKTSSNMNIYKDDRMTNSSEPLRFYTAVSDFPPLAACGSPARVGCRSRGSSRASSARGDRRGRPRGDYGLLFDVLASCSSPAKEQQQRSCCGAAAELLWGGGIYIYIYIYVYVRPCDRNHWICKERSIDL